jgi:hypothetical protein
MFGGYKFVCDERIHDDELIEDRIDDPDEPKKESA